MGSNFSGFNYAITKIAPLTARIIALFDFISAVHFISAAKRRGKYSDAFHRD